MQDADALVVSTPWPEFRTLDLDAALRAMSAPLVIDGGGHLAQALGGREDVSYVRVGMGTA